LLISVNRSSICYVYGIASTKRALLVGLTYRNSSSEEGLDELPRCQNDIVALKHCLINKKGFLPKDIQVITDGANLIATQFHSPV
jgi:hypothetical protein